MQRSSGPSAPCGLRTTGLGLEGPCVAVSDGWASANETQRLIWAGLREFLGAEFGCTHAYDGVVFIQGPAHYRYALFTQPDQPAVHMINSQFGELWRQVAAVPGRAPGLLAEGNAFAQMRVKASNPGWVGTTVHRLPRANPEGHRLPRANPDCHRGPTRPGLVRSKSV